MIMTGWEMASTFGKDRNYILMQDSEKRIIFRFVSAIQIASRVIFFLEVSIKIILTHNIMKLNEEEMYIAHPWLLTVPRVGIIVE